jgi:hypothetical protein
MVSDQFRSIDKPAGLAAQGRLRNRYKYLITQKRTGTVYLNNEQKTETR